MGNKIARRREAVEDRYTYPQGLYEHRDIDYKKLRRLILDSKLAPCYPGEEDCAIDLEECPICFLYYPSLNRSRCCVKGICTECFLQMKPHQSTNATQCPFCKTSNYAVEYRGVRTKEEKGMDQIEEQKVIEAQIRMQQQELQDEEERRLRRQSLMRPSRIATTEEVENLDLSCRLLSVQSSQLPTQGNELVSQGSSTTPRSRRLSHPRYNRDDGFEMDLEDLMVMEAIWLSVQEPENQRDHILPVSSQLHLVPGREASPSGGLALAVAALAERQHLRAEPSQSASTVDRARLTNHPPERWTVVPLDNGSLSCREDGNWEMDQGPGVHSMVGNTADGSNVASPLPAANDMNVDHLPPENFDEQMMLAMAVSLAEARARTSAPSLT